MQFLKHSYPHLGNLGLLYYVGIIYIGFSGDNLQSRCVSDWAVNLYMHFF